MATELYELLVQGNHNGKPVENVIHYQGANLTANDTFRNGDDLVVGWDANILPLWLNCFPATYQVNRLAARRSLPKGSAVFHTQYQVGTQVGNFGSIAASYQLCPTVFLVPPMGTKSGGKIFMPCIDDTAINGNKYSVGYISAISSLMVAMMANFGTGSITWQLAIMSRKLQTFALVQAYTLSARIGFQRRRAHMYGRPRNKKKVGP